MFMIADTWTMGVQGGGRVSMCNYITTEYFLNDTIKYTGQYAGWAGVLAKNYDATKLNNNTNSVHMNLRQWTY